MAVGNSKESFSDYETDEDDHKERKALRNSMARSICSSIGLLIGLSLFFICSYHLLVYFSYVVQEFSLSSSSSAKKSSPYDQFVQSLVTGSNALRGNSIATKRAPKTYPLVVGEEFRKAVRQRIANRYNYLEKNRPVLIPQPPKNGEISLPSYQSLYSIIEKWNPDIPDVPIDFKETIQHFNYGDPKEKAMAEAYRNAELPFKLYNVSEFNLASEKWDDAYLTSHITKMKGQSHYQSANDNHFMFWALRGGVRSTKNWKPPTKTENSMTFPEYLNLIKQADEEKWNATHKHYYFTLGVPPHDHAFFVGKDLPSFSDYHNNYFVTNTKANKGIQCRFGMRGVIAETHYDSGKNFVTMLHGAKRYILSSPRTCKYLGIIGDVKHPSYRHSVIDWSDLNQCKANNFDKVDAIDTVVHVGEVLYIPSFWFHYIVSLDYSIQCNSRSGFPENLIGQEDIRRCFAAQGHNPF